jgi:hypothetical protein
MCPIAQAERHDAPGLVFEDVPGAATMIDQIAVVAEDAVGEVVVAQELPGILLRVEFGALGRQRHDGDVARHRELGREVPSGLVEQQRGMATRCDVGRNGGEMQVHRGDVAEWQDQAGRLARGGADRAEDIGGSGALIERGRRPCAAPGPAAGYLVLLADPGLVTEPDLYVGGIEIMRLGNCLQTVRPVFLNVSIAPAACAWWRGRADSLR